MSDQFQNQLDTNFGIRPRCHYFLKSLKVILISSQGWKLLAHEAFPLKRVHLLALETQGWSGGISRSRFSKKHLKIQLILVNLLLFSHLSFSFPAMAGRSPPFPMLSNCRIYVVGCSLLPCFLLPWFSQQPHLVPILFLPVIPSQCPSCMLLPLSVP